LTQNNWGWRSEMQLNWSSRLEVIANARQPSSVSPCQKEWYGDHCRTSVGGFGPQDGGIYTETSRTEMSTYTVFIEPTATGYSAYVPDLPGCVSAASTLEETRQLIKEAIEFHIEGMRMNGEAVPEPTRVEQIEVSA
jgi:predicted RNase H-like HicB family nuclease